MVHKEVEDRMETMVTFTERQLRNKSVPQLNEVCKELDIKRVIGLPKKDMIVQMLEWQEERFGSSCVMELKKELEQIKERQAYSEVSSDNGDDDMDASPIEPAIVQRDGKGRLLPGSRLNPLGITSTVPQDGIKQLLSAMVGPNGEDIFEALKEIAFLKTKGKDNGDEFYKYGTNHRLEAMQMMMDRFWGRPRMGVDIEQNINTYTELAYTIRMIQERREGISVLPDPTQLDNKDK